MQCKPNFEFIYGGRGRWRFNVFGIDPAITDNFDCYILGSCKCIGLYWKNH